MLPRHRLPFFWPSLPAFWPGIGHPRHRRPFKRYGYNRWSICGGGGSFPGGNFCKWGALIFTVRRNRCFWRLEAVCSWLGGLRLSRGGASGTRCPSSYAILCQVFHFLAFGSITVSILSILIIFVLLSHFLGYSSLSPILHIDPFF